MAKRKGRKRQVVAEVFPVPTPTQEEADAARMARQCEHDEANAAALEAERRWRNRKT